MEVARWYEKDECLRSVYFALLVVRFISPCFIQNGYLYPDEFFQSSEIMAKDILQINSTVTWEWNEAFPVRSPISAFLTSGIPFLILKLLSKLKLLHISANLLLIFPRIYMTLLSVLSFDIPVYVVSRRLKLKPFHCLFVLSTSYVTHVFATRSFSNTLETCIFGILLMLLIDPGNKQSSSTGKEMVKNTEDMPSYNCILAGCLTSLGVFCRQTFLVFALVPYLGYFLIWLNRKQNTWLQFISKLMFMALGFVGTTVAFVLLDSIYFGYLQDGKIVLTPWNFIKYNSLQSHSHGHHPLFAHFLVNIPLLFGPLAFLFYFKLGSLLVCRFFGPRQEEQTKNKVDVNTKMFYKVLLLLSVLVPVLILSLIPHQEPRFIMPVILPLVLLFSSGIVGPKSSSTILMSWSMWNVIGCVLFGIQHQGGVVPSLLHLHKVIYESVDSSAGPYCHHVVYFHTYMPPTHLLAWPNSDSINKGHKLYIHDLAGSSQEIFNQTLSKLKSYYCEQNQNMLYIIYPATVQIPVDIEDNDANITKFFPHLTMEDPPDLHQRVTDFFTSEDGEDFALTNMNIVNMCTTYWKHFLSQLKKLKNELSLNLYTSQF